MSAIPAWSPRGSVLPGFAPAMGYALFYLGLIVLIPLAALALKTSTLTWSAFWETVTAPRVLAAYRLSFGASLIAAFSFYRWHHGVVVPKEHPLATTRALTLEQLAQFRSLPITTASPAARASMRPSRRRSWRPTWCCRRSTAT